MLSYIAMTGDLMHYGHIKVFKLAASYGKVIVGLLTDKAVESFKGKPVITYENRKFFIESIKYVDIVIPQQTLSYKENLLVVQPDFVFHGDDWKTGVQKKTRLEVIEILKNWNGKLIEPEYTKGVSSTLLKEKLC